MTFRHRAKIFYKQLVFNLSARNSPIFIAYYKYLYKPRKNSLMEFIDRYSKAHKNISVVQVGANDGFNHDPIHVFIKRDKWRGVLLEPQQDVYHQYLERLHRRSASIHTLSAAMDYQDGEKTLYKIAFSDARWATGLASFKKSVIDEAVASGHIAKMAAKEGVRLPDKQSDYLKKETIPCISPETLLKRYKIDKIDWLQIDTEGFDFEIIKMFKIEKTKPKVIVFEQGHLSEEEKQQCTDLLTKNKYHLINYGNNALALLDNERKWLAY